MNYSKRFFLIFLVLTLTVSLFGAGCGKSRKVSYKRGKWTIKTLTGSVSEVKMTKNKRVRAWLDYFQGPGRARFGRYLKRSGRYIPMMKQILKQHGVPEEVVYISLIESGYTADAKSYASAVGFWQFMSYTARDHNLRMDTFVDERMDFEKATHAAANYFVTLYNMFGDWHLAFAAYNSGPGKVRKGIKKYKTDNFWKLTTRGRRYFKAEQRDYVPKYIAAALIAENPRKYGFKVRYDRPLEFDVVKASTQTDHQTIAKCSRSSVEEIAMLNPELIYGVTPPGEKHYKIRVPKGKGEKFKRTFARLPRKKRLSKAYAFKTQKSRPRYHRVKSGESLSKIARKYGVSTRKLMALNKIRNPRALRKGKKLKIPGAVSRPKYEKSSYTYNDSQPQVAEVRTVTKTVNKLNSYKIKSGDNLNKIAKSQGVSVADIKKWNKMKNNTIIAGKDLKIYKKVKIQVPITEVASQPAQVASASDTVKTKTLVKKYKVQRGDSLGRIARNHKISVKQLKSLNKIKGHRIKAGSELIVAKKVVPAANENVQGSTNPSIDIAMRPSSSAKKKTTRYKIKSGDTLGEIALKHKLSVKELRSLNNIKGNNIRAGKTLIVSKSVASRGASVPTSSRLATNTRKYKIKKGDTWWSIARRNATTVAKLKALNPKVGKYLKIGKTINVSGKPSDIVKTEAPVQVAVRESAPIVVSTPEKKTSSPKLSTSKYKVQSGDTLYGIARRNNMTVSQLCEVNNIDRTATLKPGAILKVKSGQRVTIPTKSSDRLMISSASPVANSVKYKVQSGDTAWNIAKKHKVSISQIKTWNSDKDITKIKPGDILKIKVAKKSSL